MLMFLAYSRRMNAQRIEQQNARRRAEWEARRKKQLPQGGA